MQQLMNKCNRILVHVHVDSMQEDQYKYITLYGFNNYVHMLAIIMTNISIYFNLDKGENDIAKRTCIFFNAKRLGQGMQSL